MGCSNIRELRINEHAIKEVNNTDTENENSVLKRRDDELRAKRKKTKQKMKRNR